MIGHCASFEDAPGVMCALQGARFGGVRIERPEAVDVGWVLDRDNQVVDDSGNTGSGPGGHYRFAPLAQRRDVAGEGHLAILGVHADPSGFEIGIATEGVFDLVGDVDPLRGRLERQRVGDPLTPIRSCTH